MPTSSPNFAELREVLFQNNRFEHGFTSDPALVERVKQYDPVACAATVAGMLVNPDMQSNAFRLEAMAHFFMAVATGDRAPCLEIIRDTFNSFYKTYGRCEDPAEDVFISLVSNVTGNFRIFEGTWEASGFLLQRFVDILDHMPDSLHFERIRRQAFALLSLSEAIAERNQLGRYCVGKECPRREIPEYILSAIEEQRTYIKLSAPELAAKNISAEDLIPFIFSLKDSHKILKENSGYTSLEEKPLFFDGNNYYVLLPTAISLAIRRFIIESVRPLGLIKSLEHALSASYATHFAERPVLGFAHGVPARFSCPSNASVAIAECCAPVDVGRNLHLLFIRDGFESAEQGWFSGYSSDVKTTSDEIFSRIKRMQDHEIGQGGHKETLTLIVFCGWGRASLLDLKKPQKKNWHVKAISAYDLTTLSMSADVSCLTLFRLFHAETVLKNYGVEIIGNINGVLNLYAWSKNLGHHLVPHSDLPDTDTEQNIFFHIQQNSLLSIRKEVLEYWDIHTAISPEGEGITIMKESSGSFFEEDRSRPVYVSLTDVHDNRLRALVPGSSISWWCTVVFPEDADRKIVYKLWEAARYWLISAAPKLSEFFVIPVDKVDWKICLDSLDFPDRVNVRIEYAELAANLIVEIEFPRVINAIFPKNFPLGFYGEFNDAERCLVLSLVRGIQKICRRRLSEQEEEHLIDGIIPNRWAKHIHMFHTKTPSEYLCSNLAKPILIESSDDATMRIGLGWLARHPKNGNVIRGKSECTAYFQELVGKLWELIQKELKTIDRTSILTRLLENLEAIDFERTRWNRTVRATLALHTDKEDVLSSSVEQISRLDASAGSSKIAIEMALCESPLTGGASPGELELTRLQAYAALIYQIGNWSDAIKYELRPAYVKISPLGELLFDAFAEAEIASKYILESQAHLLEEHAQDYSRLFEEPSVVPTIKDQFEADFLAAWTEEFGFTVDEARQYIDDLEDMGLKKNSAVLLLSQSELQGCSSLPKNIVTAILATWVLCPRQSWTTLPKGYIPPDWYPWRFKRKLSLIARPVIQLDATNNPHYLVAPNFIRKSFVYSLRNSYSATFDENRFQSKKMRKWIGSKRNLSGHAFNSKVKEKLISLGWMAAQDITLPELLNCKLDKDYGDIDVLAWHKKSGRILAIECKDLQFAKTEGEIAKQIFEFKGQVDAKGYPDRLMKHLSRLAVLTRYPKNVERYTGLAQSSAIEAVLVFSNLVPMAFSNNEALSKVTILYFESLSHALKLEPDAENWSVP